MMTISTHQHFPTYFRDFPVRVGICLSPDARFEMRSWSPVGRNTLSEWASVRSIQELDADTVGGKYFWDAPVGYILIHTFRVFIVIQLSTHCVIFNNSRVIRFSPLTLE